MCMCIVCSSYSIGYRALLVVRWYAVVDRLCGRGSAMRGDLIRKAKASEHRRGRWTGAAGALISSRRGNRCFRTSRIDGPRGSICGGMALGHISRWHLSYESVY